MSKNSLFYAQNDWLCPELKYADVADVEFQNARFKVMDSQRMFICPYGPNAEDGCTDGSIIFIGKPYCSYVETTEKYKLLSPFRSLMKRHEISVLNAEAGIFVTIQNTLNPILYAFIYPKSYKFEFKEMALSKTEPLTEEYSKALALLDKYWNLEDNDMLSKLYISPNMKQTLTAISKILKIPRKDLIEKVRNLGLILQDQPFLGKLEALKATLGV